MTMVKIMNPQMLVIILLQNIVNLNAESGNIRQEPSTLLKWDPNGYVFFCLCMGRFGNQADHFLGGMAFAKALNRTFVIPPFRTYKNVMFTEWFQLEPIQKYHKAILAEDFMKYLAPENWPEQERSGFCWKTAKDENTDCAMKEGNPFGPFWDGLGVGFNKSIVLRLGHHSLQADDWNENFPPEKYSVLAFRGAPAPFPVKADNRHLQKYLIFSDTIEAEAQGYINDNFPNKPFVGLHLRNGIDWEKACSHAENAHTYMASPQCLERTNKKVTKQICFPDQQEVLRLVEKAVIEVKAEVVFVATDKDPMISVIQNHLREHNVKVYHADPYLPVVDVAILIKSDHFIGNCVSSFTAFVKRARDVQGKSTYFFGFS